MITWINFFQLAGMLIGMICVCTSILMVFAAGMASNPDTEEGKKTVRQGANAFVFGVALIVGATWDYFQWQF